MYKSHKADWYKERYSLSQDYCLQGLLSYGAWDKQKHFNKLKNILDKLGIKHVGRQLDGFLSNIYEIEIDSKYYWFAVAYGGAVLSEYVHLACIFGSNKNIHIGSCGGLYPKMQSLDFVVPNWSFGDDSVTRVYSRDIKDFRHYSDKNLSEQLKSKISLSNKILEGPIITCQAMMGETWEDVERWSNEGYHGVEMETSTVFSISNSFKIPSASIMYVSDNLIKGQTVGDDSHVAQKDIREFTKDEVYKAGILTLLN